MKRTNRLLLAMLFILLLPAVAGAAGLSTFAANKVLDHALGVATWWSGSPPARYLALHTGAPGLTCANEAAGGWYTREAVTFNAATTSGATNNGEVAWDAVTGSSVTVTDVCVWDASTAGNCITCVSLGSSRQFTVGAVPRIADAGMTVTITGTGASNYLIPKELDLALGTASYTIPTTTYLQNFTTNPTAAGSGAQAGPREAITWNAAASGVSTNNGEIDFGEAGSALGTLAYWGVYDASSAGNLIAFGAWDTPADVQEGDTFKVPDAGLKIRAVPAP